MIHVTDAAAEYLKELLDEKGFSPEEGGLRLLVEKGGCAGMQYAMQVGKPQQGDLVFEHGGVKLFIQEDSRGYLEGCRLDYVDSLNDSGFKIDNPKAVRSCGCGTSFEPNPEGQSAAEHLKD